jgi:30S ribosomal protein S31
MGKGDRKTRRGKIIKGTYGVRRPRKKVRKGVVTKSSEKINKK